MGSIQSSSHVRNKSRNDTEDIEKLKTSVPLDEDNNLIGDNIISEEDQEQSGENYSEEDNYMQYD